MKNESSPIGFIGLGGMGTAMSLNLLADGHTLRVWNRTKERTKPLADNGASVADHPADVASPGGIVFSLVADDRALDEVSLGAPSLAEKLGPGGIHVSVSTIAPTTAQSLAEQHAKHGVTYLACPVFGRPTAVAARNIFFCIAGPADAKSRVRPILEKLSQGVFDFGERPAAANVMKLAGNFMIAAATETLAEAAAFCEKNGLPPADAIDFLTKTYFNCTAYKNYGKKIVERTWTDVGFKLHLGLKDMNLASQAANLAHVPMPVLALIRNRYLASMAKGRGNLDWATTAKLAREDAGLE